MSDQELLSTYRRAYVRANGRSFVHAGEHLCLATLGTYADGSQAVQLETWSGEPFVTLSVRLDEPPPHPAYFWAKTWSENAPVVATLRTLDLFLPSSIITPVGYVEAEAWQLNDTFGKQDACLALGIDWNSADPALPQPWLDEIVRVTEVEYDQLRMGFVWSYAGAGSFGHPEPLNPLAAAALSIFESRKVRS